MPIIKINGKPTYVDFVEYVRDGKTFADREYEKWLKESDARKECDLNVQSKQQTLD